MLLVFTIILKWQIFSNFYLQFSRFPKKWCHFQFFMTNQVFVDFVKTGNKIKLFKIYGAPCENFTVLLNYQFEDLLLAKWFMSIIPYLENNPREGEVSVNGFNKWSFNYSIEIPLKYLRNLLYYYSLKMKMIMYKIVPPPHTSMWFKTKRQ